MPDQTFYVGAQRNGTLTGYVPAKFLMRNGAYVTDPTPGGSQDAFLYSDAAGSNKTHGTLANPNNYLIIPANYDEQRAKAFAKEIIATMSGSLGDETGGAAPLTQALLNMRAAFKQGGSEDLQRHPQWGVPKDSFVPAFKGGASYHVGYVTAQAGLPKLFVDVGGGDVNKRAAATMPPGAVDTSAPYGNSWHNYRNIGLGFSNGGAASEPPVAFNSYGFPARSQDPPSAIGEGQGIAPFVNSLAGVSPDEPPPPTWPPEPSAPVRYLNSYRIRY